MDEFDKIHLIWRQGQGAMRHTVGVLQKLADGSHTFNYSLPEETLRRIEGFTPYTEFQNLTEIYTNNVAEIFGQRLTKLDRPDISNFLKFWEVDAEKAQDKFYLLGKTQGLTATDNFEFLAEYNLLPDTHFLTELASLSIIQLPKASVSIGDILRFEAEPSNQYDPHAIKVYKADVFLGYIKRYHNLVFHQPGADKLNISVKAIEQNGFIKRIFIKVWL